MTKWADYLVSAVQYDRARQVTRLRRHADTGEIGTGEIIDKATAVSDISRGVSYMTIHGTISNWKLGERIRAPQVGGQFRLRADDNKVEYDNLGSVLELETDPVPDAARPAKAVKKRQLHISAKDKAMLKNMGAAPGDVSQAHPETSPQPELENIRPHSPRGALPKGFEDTARRDAPADDARDTKDDGPKVSTHGTLPKGFDTVQESHKTAKDDGPQVSTHGTLPKGFDSTTNKDAPAKTESPDTLPKDDAAQKESLHETVKDAEPSRKTPPKETSKIPPKDIPPKELPRKIPPKKIPKKAEPPRKTPPKETSKIPPKDIPKDAEPPRKIPPKKTPKAELLRSTTPKKKPEAKDAKKPDAKRKESLDDIRRQILALKKEIKKFDQGSVEIYCAKCKKKRTIRDAKRTREDGISALRGTCPTCKGGVYRAVKH